MAKDTARSAVTMPATASTRTIGTTISAMPALIRTRNRKNGRRINKNGRQRIPNSRPKKIRNGKVNRKNMRPPPTLLTCGRLQEFRRSELVGRAVRRTRREIHHRFVANPLVQALDDRGAASGGLLRLGKAQDDAESDEEDEDEHRARRQSLKGPQNDVHQILVHASASSCGWGFSISYCTSPRFTSSMATRSA